MSLKIIQKTMNTQIQLKDTNYFFKMKKNKKKVKNLNQLLMNNSFRAEKKENLIKLMQMIKNNFKKIILLQMLSKGKIYSDKFLELAL